jgi:hypothetical protein
MNISLELMNAILQYLGSRPYVEVADFITKVQAEAQADVAAQAERADELKNLKELVQEVQEARLAEQVAQVEA